MIDIFPEWNETNLRKSIYFKIKLHFLMLFGNYLNNIFTLKTKKSGKSSYLIFSTLQNYFYKLIQLHRSTSARSNCNSAVSSPSVSS
jgi:hypothetical protein